MHAPSSPDLCSYPMPSVLTTCPMPTYCTHCRITQRLVTNIDSAKAKGHLSETYPFFHDFPEISTVVTWQLVCYTLCHIYNTQSSIMAWFCLFRVKLILRQYSNLSCICTAIDGLVYGCHRLENRSVRYHIISYALPHGLWTPWTGPNCKDTKP